MEKEGQSTGGGQRERKEAFPQSSLCISAAGEFLFRSYFLLSSNGTYRDNEKGNRAINTVYAGDPAELLKQPLRHIKHNKMDKVHCLSVWSGQEWKETGSVFKNSSKSFVCGPHSFTGNYFQFLMVSAKLLFINHFFFRILIFIIGYQYVCPKDVLQK